MPTKSTVQTTRIKTRVEQLREEIEDASQKLAYYESVPQDDYENGAILVAYKKFNETGIRYTYSLLKAANFWYVTGQSSRFTWDGLVDYLYANLSQSGGVQLFLVSEISEVS